MQAEAKRGPDALVDHWFRHAYGRAVAQLARRFGLSSLPRIEDAVQDALVTALTSWSLRGPPEDPGAWLYQVARNTLVDRARRDAAWSRVAASMPEAAPPREDVQLGREIADDVLRMLFVACDPRLPEPSQLVFALKVVCGFGTKEIAVRLFTTEANVYKRLSRARELLRELGTELDTPPDVPARLPTVHAVLYLLFNEGYGASTGDSLVRQELCDEALRLGHMLLASPACGGPETQALVALFHLHAARLATRVSESGDLLTLAEQDRARWDSAHVMHGLALLTSATRAETLCRWHLEAMIAAHHVTAPSFAATCWDEIAELYQALDYFAPSPLHALNRAVALAEGHGAEAGLAALEGVRLPPGMAGYYLWDAVVGELLRRAGHAEQARPYLERAAVAAPSEAERALLQRRIRALSPP